MARLLLGLLIVTGCLESPPEGKADGGADRDGDTASTPDGAASCPSVVNDVFDGDEIDDAVWVEERIGDVSSSPVGGIRRMQATGDEANSIATISLLSRDERTLADTHVVATFSVSDEMLASSDAGVSWLRQPFVDYYAVFVRDGEVQAEYANPETVVTSLCDPGNTCQPYSDGTVVTARMSATEESVQLSVSFDGQTFIDFDPAPNTGLSYPVRLGVIANSPNTMAINVDEIFWYECPLP